MVQTADIAYGFGGNKYHISYLCILWTENEIICISSSLYQIQVNGTCRVGQATDSENILLNYWRMSIVRPGETKWRIE